MGDFGLKIMREGADVTSTDIRDYVIHSSYKNPKLLPVGTENVTTDAFGNFSLTIDHGLDYAPMYIVHILVNGKWYNISSFCGVSDPDTLEGSFMYSYTDTANLYVASSYSYWSGVQNWTVKYSIIIDER